MAGYNGFSRSNNAVAAEDNGRLTATALAKILKCHSGAINKLLKPVEWHHTSSWYTRTDYYLEPALIDLATGGTDWGWEEGEKKSVTEILAKLRAWKPVAVTIYENCKAEWIEWSGSRNHPKATEQKAEGCRVERKGSYVTIYAEGLAPFRKKLGANGLYLTTAEGVLLYA